MLKPFLTATLLVSICLQTALGVENPSERKRLVEDLKSNKSAFLASENLKTNYLRLVELEAQALQIADDEPLKLGSIGSAILDIYSGSQTGHYAMSLFYDHVDSMDAKQSHEKALALIQSQMTKGKAGSDENPYSVLTINDAKTFARKLNFSPVGSIYRTAEPNQLGLLLLASRKSQPLKYWFYDLPEILLALPPGKESPEPQGWPLIRELANASDSAAQAAIGAYLVNQRKFNSAISWLSVSSRSGNLLAHSLLGRTYWSQSRLAKTEKNRQEKLELAQENYLHAIALGSTESMYTLASLYLQGHYGSDNEQAALTLLKNASSLKHVDSLLYLGQLYSGGRASIKKDIALANKYFTRAASTGDESAAIIYGRFLIGQRDPKIDSSEIKKWLRTHTDKGSAEAMVVMANLYATGTATPPSITAAIRWYKRAVKKEPKNSDVVNEVAWTLTVSDIKGLKRTRYAKKIMDKLMKSNGSARNQPEFLDTWAATHAASGDFEKAMTLQEEAINVASRDRTPVINILREHLELFRVGKPVTERAP